MLRLTSVRKTFVDGGLVREVLRGVNATFQVGDTVGILGRNGAGKSTLMRILAGVEKPSSGLIERHMSVSWPLGYSGGVHPALTGADNARFIARIYGRPSEWTVDFVRDFAELDEEIHAPVRTYSSGMKSRLSFALSLAVDFDCYLLDEITSAGDARFNAKCQQALLSRRRRSALILVSHNADTVRTFCRYAAVLNGGRLHFHENMDEAFRVYEQL
ncbi:ATP-binding cassette domain-containing protein [Roseococcus thiosulfatophilus]|uniref:ATP-binding cassette domain-containing protein n=1 Tax=Roseococcus thiosulfatophilus TaxID=35813 RepID=UPI001A8EB353